MDRNALVINFKEKSDLGLDNFLASEDYKVTECSAREEALETLQSNSFSLIVLDASCPELKSCYKELFAGREKEPKLWLVSAFEDLEDFDLATITNCTFLKVPSHKKVFREALETVESLENIDGSCMALLCPPLRTKLGQIVNLVVRFCDATDQVGSRLTLGLSELIRNCYEHGCLGIPSAEKQQLLDDGSFDNTTANKECVAFEGGHYFKIVVKLGDDNEVEFSFQDSGEGFNWRGRDFSKPNSSRDTHGRGLYLISKLFDSLSFNHEGNCATVTKRLR